MRTIKFRGQDEDGKWLYGDLRQRMGYWPAIIESYCTDEGKVGYREIAVKEDTVGQFTNLHDMDGMEIYEGDVLMIEGIKTNRYSKVWWNPDKFTFYIGHSPMDAYLRKDGNLCDFCIVGNIYDNPKL